MAQDTNYVYIDTGLLHAPAEARLLSEGEPVGEEEDFTADTLLKKNQLFVEVDSIKAMKNLKSFAYAKNLDSLLKEYQQNQVKDEQPVKNKLSWLERFLLSAYIKYFFWILAGVFVSLILYKLFFTEGFFQQSYARVNVTALPEESGNIITNIDYGKLVQQAVNNSNYRLAVRYHYLQTLQKLALKGAIQFAADKTNNQYLRELLDKPYQSAFATLTLNYEYVWYGEFEIDRNIFEAVQNKFKQFNNGV